MELNFPIAFLESALELIITNTEHFPCFLMEDGILEKIKGDLFMETSGTIFRRKTSREKKLVIIVVVISLAAYTVILELDTRFLYTKNVHYRLALDIVPKI